MGNVCATQAAEAVAVRTNDTVFIRPVSGAAELFPATDAKVAMPTSAPVGPCDVVLEPATGSTAEANDAAPDAAPKCPCQNGTASSAALTSLQQRMPERQPGPASAWPRAPPGAKLKKCSMDRTQPSIATLLADNAEAISAIRASLADEPLAVRYDDLFLVRFILSNGKGAEAAVRATVHWREDNAERLKRSGSGEKHPMEAEMGRLNIADVLDTRTLLDEPVFVVRSGLCQNRLLMDTYTEDQIIDYLSWSKEYIFQLCDEATRRTGRLVKQVNVIDMHGLRLADQDKRFYRALGRSSKDTELYYPQLLAVTAGVNAPTFLNLIWVFVKRLMPKKTIEKTRICGARDTNKQAATACPFLVHNFAPEEICSFLGGTLPPSQKLLCAADRTAA